MLEASERCVVGGGGGVGDKKTTLGSKFAMRPPFSNSATMRVRCISMSLPP